MADDSRTFQEFLIEQRKTNEQLASLRKENVLMGQILADIRRDAEQDSTTQAYIQSALPEILSDTKNTNRQIKLDKDQRKEEVKEGLFEIDDILKDLKNINLLGFDALLEVMEKSAEFDRVEAFRKKREELASGEEPDMPKPADDGEVDGEKAGELATTGILAGLTGGITAAGLGAFALSFGKGILKGGLLGGIGLLLGNYLADNVDDEFIKEGLSKGIPAAAIGSAFGGLPGALAGIAITGLGGMVDFLSGKSDELSTYDFASATLGTAGAAYFAKSKVTTLLKAGKGGVPVRLGAALLSTPVLIAGGIGIALGVGARFLANKMDEYQDKTLDQAKKISEQIDKDMGEQFAKSETKLLERLGLTGIGDIVGAERSDTGAFRQATVEGVEEFREQGKLSVDTAQTMSDAADSLMKISDENLKIILEDKVKARDLLTTLQNLTVLAVEDQITASTEEILLFQSKLAKLAEGLDVDVGKAYNLDILSQIADIQQTIKEKKEEIATSGFEESSMAMKALKKQLKDAEGDLEELSLVADSMGLGVSIKDIIEDVGAGRLQDLIAQTVSGQMPMINQSITADDAVIESADVDLKNAFIRMTNGIDLTKDLEMAISNAGQGSFINMGGNTTAMSNSNSIIIAPSVTPNGKTEARDKTIN